jgi:hypothetical protein
MSSDGSVFTAESPLSVAFVTNLPPIGVGVGVGVSVGVGVNVGVGTIVPVGVGAGVEVGLTTTIPPTRVSCVLSLSKQPSSLKALKWTSKLPSSGGAGIENDSE